MKLFIGAFLLAQLFGLTGCFNTGEVTTNEPVTSTSNLTVKPSPGPRAAKIIFKQANPGGSFSPAPQGGTPAQVGQGLKGVRIFNPDDSLLASGGPNDPSWPKFIKSFEIGIAGSNNSAAQSAHCARFGTPQDANIRCAPDPAPPPAGVFDQPCGCPDQSFCVAEYGCSLQSATQGNGGPNDGIYILVELDRSPTALAPHENLMAVLDVTVSGMNGGPSNPQTCFTAGQFNAANPNCADQSWYLFLKHEISNIYQPFSVLVPPIPSGINRTERRLGSQRVTIERTLPIAADPNLKFIQFSRINGLPTSSPQFTNTCFDSTVGPNAGFSALCVGIVFHALSLFRI